MTEKETFERLEAGDRILFNDRKVPLTIETRDDNRLHVEGPHGGEYILFPAENTDIILVANKGSREYASKVEDLRKVGKWGDAGEKSWKHSRTGCEIRLVKNNAGFWTVETDLEFDTPKYGFSNMEAATEEVEKLMEEHPEG